MKKKQSEKDKIEKVFLSFSKNVWREAAKRQGLSRKDTKKFVDELTKAWEEGLKSSKSTEEMGKAFKEIFKKYGVDVVVITDKKSC